MPLKRTLYSGRKMAVSWENLSFSALGATWVVGLRSPSLWARWSLLSTPVSLGQSPLLT